jgi:hypothetical protein
MGQFAYTGLSPEKGYVGFVNIAETDNGVRFMVRSEGEDPPTSSYEIPKHEAVNLLRAALKGMADVVEGWMPIETAPKNKLVLLAFDHHPTTVGRFECGTWVYAFCVTEGGDTPRRWQPIPN